MLRFRDRLGLKTFAFPLKLGMTVSCLRWVFQTDPSLVPLVLERRISVVIFYPKILQGLLEALLFSCLQLKLRTSDSAQGTNSPGGRKMLAGFLDLWSLAGIIYGIGRLFKISIALADER